MAAFLALLLLLGAMFAGAVVVDAWRARRLRTWARGHGLAPVDRRADGGALVGHATRFAPRVRSFGLTFHQATTDDEIWIAEHRARVTTRPVEKWHTLVVVRLPGAALPAIVSGPTAPAAAADPALASWPHGGDIAIEGEFVRWRRPGVLWPWSAAAALTRGRELSALVADRARGH